MGHVKEDPVAWAAWATQPSMNAWSAVHRCMMGYPSGPLARLCAHERGCSTCKSWPWPEYGGDCSPEQDSQRGTTGRMHGPAKLPGSHTAARQGNEWGKAWHCTWQLCSQMLVPVKCRQGLGPNLSSFLGTPPTSRGGCVGSCSSPSKGRALTLHWNNDPTLVKG